MYNNLDSVLTANLTLMIAVCYVQIEPVYNILRSQIGLARDDNEKTSKSATCTKVHRLRWSLLQIAVNLLSYGIGSYKLEQDFCFVL